jgi:hypothetical protein
MLFGCSGWTCAPSDVGMTVSVIAKRHSSHCEKSLPIPAASEIAPPTATGRAGVGAGGNNCGRAPDARPPRLACARAGGTPRAAQPHLEPDILTALTILNEAGSDMSKWKTEHHFVSWLRLCPDNTPKRAGPVQAPKARPLEGTAVRSKQKGQQSFLCCPRGLYPPPGTSPNLPDFHCTSPSSGWTSPRRSLRLSSERTVQRRAGSGRRHLRWSRSHVRRSG